MPLKQERESDSADEQYFLNNLATPDEIDETDQRIDGELSDSDIQQMTEDILKALHDAEFSTDPNFGKIYDQLLVAAHVYHRKVEKIENEKKVELLRKMKVEKNLMKFFSGTEIIAISLLILKGEIILESDPFLFIMLIFALCVILFAVYIQLGEYIHLKAQLDKKIEIYPGQLFHERKAILIILSIILPEWEIKEASFNEILLVNSLIANTNGSDYLNETDHNSNDLADEQKNFKQKAQSTFDSQIAKLEDEKARRLLLIELLGVTEAEKYFRENPLDE